MKFWLKGNVTIPHKPRTVGGLISWARGVNRALAELRDRKIVGTAAPSRAGGTKNLQPYIRKTGEDWKISITPGFFGSLVPSFGADLLTADPAPAATLSEATSLWLVVEWEPASEEDDGTHWIMPGGTLVSAVFELAGTQPAETAADVTEAGVVTNGVYAILWAELFEDSGRYTLEPYRSENRAPGFCPPGILEYPIG